MYSPSSGEVSASNLNSPPSEVGFAKLSDDSINEMKSIDGFYYYKIEQEVYEDEDDEFSFGNRENSFIYIRTKNEFIDTMKSFGFSDSYETCQGTIDVEDCTWQFQNNLPYLNSFNEYGSTALDTWMTDRDGTIDCVGIDSNQRCFSYGLNWVKIVQIGKSYTPTADAIGIMSKSSINNAVGGTLFEVAKLSDADINAISKKVIFEEVTVGTPALSMTSITVEECKAYARSNSIFSWGGVSPAVGDYDTIGCVRYVDTHPTHANQVYFSTKTTGSYNCDTTLICIKMNIQHYNGLHYYKFFNKDSLYQPIVFFVPQPSMMIRLQVSYPKILNYKYCRLHACNYYLYVHSILTPLYFVDYVYVYIYILKNVSH